ncbi:penicillin-binding protein 2, partial [bacterium]|nr:penicillin-binding protein 2 [bacterium]
MALKNYTIENTVKITFYTLTAFVFVLLFSRYYYLQILQKTKYTLKSENNRIREIVTEPSRGVIFDRHGKVLVDNKNSNTITVIPYEFNKNPNALGLLSNILEIDKETLRKKLDVPLRDKFLPQKIYKNAPMEKIIAIEEKAISLSGVSRIKEPKRFYTSGARLSHTLGYIGEVSEKEISKEKNYVSGDLIGKNGIEKYYDNLLRGTKGIDFLEVDRLGRVVSDIVSAEETPAQKGLDLHLTIDAFLQESAEALLEGQRGAIVMIDPRNGEILAMVSKPDFNLNSLKENWSKLQTNVEVPFYNRATKSVHAPGSTFKPITLFAGLENRIVDEKWSTFCSGSFRLGNRIAHCWNHNGHGKADAFYALEQSCNVYFFNLILKMDIDKFSETAKKFHFGKKVGIDSGDELSGIVPSRTYYDKIFGKNGWSKGSLINIAIGQGEVSASPLQLAQFAMIIANKGIYYKPHFLKYYADKDGSKIMNKIESEKVDISAKSFEIVREGMHRVVDGERGTAKSARIEGKTAAGKTGTAQNPHGENHAWFIGFAPFENP